MSDWRPLPPAPKPPSLPTRPKFTMAEFWEDMRRRGFDPKADPVPKRGEAACRASVADNHL